MSNELMKIEFNKDQIALIKSQIAPKATDAELQLFLYQAKRTGLDPLTRQIYAIHRKSGQEEKMTIQTSIDGFRVIAERSGDYAGQDEPIFEESNGKLIKATIKVYRFRGDQRYCAAVGVAYWDEYVVMVDEWLNKQRTGKKVPSGLWAKMPHTMLAKVAEALALRKAYPQDLSGLYTSEEMTQADVPQKTEDVKEDAYSIVTETSDIDKEDPKNKGSMYNHKNIGTDDKPLISNIQFTKLMERVKSGDKQAFWTARDVFSFESTQKQLLQTEYNTIKETI